MSKGEGGDDRIQVQALMKLACSCGTVEAVQVLIARMPSSKIRATGERGERNFK